MWISGVLLTISPHKLNDYPQAGVNYIDLDTKMKS